LATSEGFVHKEAVSQARGVRLCAERESLAALQARARAVESEGELRRLTKPMTVLPVRPNLVRLADLGDSKLFAPSQREQRAAGGSRAGHCSATARCYSPDSAILPAASAKPNAASKRSE